MPSKEDLKEFLSQRLGPHPEGRDEALDRMRARVMDLVDRYPILRWELKQRLGDSDPVTREEVQ